MRQIRAEEYLQVGRADPPIRRATRPRFLALVAGTHGYEYPGISALQRLRQSIDPRALRGMLILVHERRALDRLGGARH